MKLESSLQTDIIKKLKKRKNSFTYKHCPDPVGYPDIEHIEQGKLFLFEVKRSKQHAKDETTPIQKYRHEELKKAGAIVKVVWSWKQVNKTLNKHLI